MLHANPAPDVSPVAYRAGTQRGSEGFFRVGQEPDGRWTLIDPAGQPFFCKAVHGVRGPAEQVDIAIAPDSVARLRRWGFNTLGAGADPAAREEGLAFMGVVDFLRAGPSIVAGEARLPDVFHPEWPRFAAARAGEACARWSEERLLLGWVTDDRIAWAQPSLARSTGSGQAGRPSLLQICLSLEPAFPAYHAAWEFVLALHGGKLESVARAWGVALRNKEVVRELTRAEEGLDTRGFHRDETRWTREFARRYFTTTAAAIRAVDPNHLVLGCRFEGLVGAAVLAECAYPAVDVALRDWRELPVAGGGEQANPVLAGNVDWTTPEFLRLPAAAGGSVRAGTRALRLTSVEWMLRRARTALNRMARHPAAVGYAWSQWQDEPGEQPPFARGLVHVDGVEACEHTELLAQFNLRVKALRAVAAVAAPTSAAAASIYFQS